MSRRRHSAQDRLFRLTDVQEKGAKAFHRGMEMESKFVSTLTGSRALLPAWFRGCRRATPYEDSNGVDAYVITERGEVPFQIKSTPHAAHEFLLERPGHPAIVVVITIKMSGKDICALVVDSIQKRLNL